MNADQLRQLKPMLIRYLKQFDDCFARSDTRGHLPTYVQGQLSDLPRKSVEPIADAAGVPPKTLQQFLSLLKWDHLRMRDRLHELVACAHSSPHAIGILDETGCPKKGTRTPGVQRQWCGATGKKDNCLVTVHLGYAVEEFHCLLDSELFLPESWSNDRARCRVAGIPDELVYRPKWQIALELFDQARANGVQFAWLTFDEGYGSKPGFLRALADREQLYVGEVPTNFPVWIDPPRVTQRAYRRRGRGRGRKVPRLVSGSRPAASVQEQLQQAPGLRDQPWVAYRVKEGDKGPMIWEVKRIRVTPKGEDGLPGQPLELLVARNVLEREKLKYFLSNAPPGTKTEVLLLVAFSRWRVERCFEDEKSELGLDHFEGRFYVGLKRHQTLTAVSHLFLARVREQWRGEKPGVDGVPGSHGSCGVCAIVVAAGPSVPARPHGGGRAVA